MIQNLKDVKDNIEARRRGFPNASSFKLLEFDFVLARE
jgi:hypothetical protein